MRINTDRSLKEKKSQKVWSHMDEICVKLASRKEGDEKYLKSLEWMDIW